MLCNLLPSHRQMDIRGIAIIFRWPTSCWPGAGDRFLYWNKRQTEQQIGARYKSCGERLLLAHG